MEQQVGSGERALPQQKIIGGIKKGSDGKKFQTFYPRNAMLARVFAIPTCPSVRLSVKRRYCVKTKISSPSGSNTILVF